MDSKNETTVPIYAKTSTMAKLIDRSPDWMEARIGTDFIEGVHFFQKSGGHRFWKIEAVMRWVESSDDPAVDEIVDKLIKGVA